MRAVCSLLPFLALSIGLHLMLLRAVGVEVRPSDSHQAESALLVTLSSVSPAGAALVTEMNENSKAPVVDVAPDDKYDGTGSVVAGKKIEPLISRSMDDYLPPSRLARIPIAMNNVDVNVDFRGLNGVVGEAEIMLLISSEGDIDDVILLDSTLPGFLVDEAIARFKAAKFTPGVAGSMAVRSRVRIKLTPPSEDQLNGNPSSVKERTWRR